MKILEMIASILLIVGGLNWGLVGLFEINLVDMIFGHASLLDRLVYILVGASAVFKLFTCCGSCGSKGSCCSK